MICERCGVELQIGDYPFCKGRSSDHAPGTAVIVGDECDFVQHNGTRDPIRFRSKQEFKRWLKANEYQVYDTHQGDMGSDKSRHTTNWSRGYDPVTAENVRILLERAFKAPHTEPPDPAMHIRTEVRELSTAEALTYVR